jgi:hypothetical protein
VLSELSDCDVPLAPIGEGGGEGGGIEGGGGIGVIGSRSSASTKARTILSDGLEAAESKLCAVARLLTVISDPASHSDTKAEMEALVHWPALRFSPVTTMVVGSERTFLNPAAVSARAHVISAA